ncbi:MAG: hypothetical protein GW761_17030 [Leptospira sp.]|nr:hypothetical protein [Leptospira sp.]
MSFSNPASYNGDCVSEYLESNLDLGAWSWKTMSNLLCNQKSIPNIKGFYNIQKHSIKVEKKASKIIISNALHYCILFFILLPAITCNIPALDRTRLDLSRLLFLRSNSLNSASEDNTPTATASDCSGSLLSWSPRMAAEANAWRSVTYGNGLFVAVSLVGTNRIMTSPDGITWTPRSAPQPNSWVSVTFGNGLFVAVSFDGVNRVMTSPDGITWTPRSASEPNEWISVAYGNGLYVAVTYTGTNRVMTSPDGTVWTSRVVPEPTNFWISVTYGNGLFVAVSSTGTNRVMTSSDGFTWTVRAASEQIGWYSVTYGNGLFVAV